MSKVLHRQHRPRRFADVMGQDHVVSALENIVENKTFQSFLFSGPSGCGKTTLARIVSELIGCEKNSILEIDAATYTGIDAMREVQDLLQYRPFGKSLAKAVIIDECHSLSKQAWQSLLKITEEPPLHAYFFFCTTEVGKVPQTIKTRCASFTLKLLSENELEKVINRVVKKEKLTISEDVKSVIIKEANGSARQALVNLSLCSKVKDKKTAIRILQSAIESDAARELCQFLVKGGSWTKAMSIVSRLEEENPESVRINVVNYISSALKNSKTERDACFFLSILEAFSEPYNPSERFAPLLLSIGRVLFQEE